MIQVNLTIQLHVAILTAHLINVVKRNGNPAIQRGMYRSRFISNIDEFYIPKLISEYLARVTNPTTEAHYTLLINFLVAQIPQEPVQVP